MCTHEKVVVKDKKGKLNTNIQEWLRIDSFPLAKLSF